MDIKLTSWMKLTSSMCWISDCTMLPFTSLDELISLKESLVYLSYSSIKINLEGEILKILLSI